MEPIIEVQELSKTYSGAKRPALKEVTVGFYAGEIVGCLGRNGAGKTTFFKLICKLLKPTKGCVKISTSLSREDFISYLPEVRGLNQKELVEIHLVDMLRYKGIDKAAAKKMAGKWLDRFKMTPYKNDRIDTLSKGNQQKIQFISAIANESPILILDEPFNGLDLVATSNLWDILFELREKGTCILFSTHDFDQSLSKCDKFLFLVNGTLKAHGKLQDIQKQYPLVLEMRNVLAAPSVLKKVLGDRYYKEGIDCIRYPVKTEQEAKRVFKNLGAPFCELFSVRKYSLEEIFLALNFSGEKK